MQIWMIGLLVVLVVLFTVAFYFVNKWLDPAAV
jgi:hypothetical protein